MSARRQFLIAEEVKRLQRALPLVTERYERPVAKAWLLAGRFWYNGNLYEPRAKHLGLGVYSLSAEVTR